MYMIEKNIPEFKYFHSKEEYVDVDSLTKEAFELAQKIADKINFPSKKFKHPIFDKRKINAIKRTFSLQNYTLWIGSIDDELTAKAYIVPGLGDAGDLAYGSKLD